MLTYLLINSLVIQDVEWLLPQLPDLKFSKRMEGYTHMDFIWVGLCIYFYRFVFYPYR